MDRMKKYKNKRGMLTVAVMLMGGVLLVLVAAISSYANSLSAINQELASIEIASQLVGSASHGFQSMLAREAVNVTYQQSNVSSNVSFGLNPQGLGNYSRDAERFAQFVSSQPGANISINAAEAKRPLFHLRPQNIAVDFGATGSVIFTPNEAEYSTGNVIGYDIKASIGKRVRMLNWTGQFAVSQGSPDALYLRIGVLGTDGGLPYEGYLNKSDVSTVQVMDDSGTAVMEMIVSPESALRIYYEPWNATTGTGQNGTIETTIMLNGTSTAELGTSIINVNGVVTNTGPVIIDEG